MSYRIGMLSTNEISNIRNIDIHPMKIRGFSEFLLDYHWLWVHEENSVFSLNEKIKFDIEMCTFDLNF